EPATPEICTLSLHDALPIYRYGRVVNPNNTTTRWNAIGIAAATGTPVHAVAPGTVVSVVQLGTYGLTVIVQHGGGDYSVYASLKDRKSTRLNSSHDQISYAV